MSDQPQSEANLVKKRAPTLYIIIAIKLLKFALFATLAVVAYTLSDNDLPTEYQDLLRRLKLNPERKFWAQLAVQVGQLTEARVVWVAVGTMLYSLFGLVEGVGLLFRVSWAGWLAIGESAFFVPIEMHELVRRFSWPVFVVMALNIFMVWYLFQNRGRLFSHHHPH